MSKKWLAIAFLIVLIFIVYRFVGVRPSLKEENFLDKIILPDGFKIEIFADNLGGSSISTPGPNPGPRMMEIKDNTIFVSIPSQGRVVALPDRDNDNEADQIITVIDDLNNPHGLAFYRDWLYIAEEDKVIRIKYSGDLKVEKNTLEKIVDLPSGGHFTRTIKIFNNSLFISVGSDCNVCFEKDERRAAITKCDMDGNNCKVFAKGLRNAVGFIVNSRTNEIFATDNGRDWLGENLPPEEVNIVKEGKDYGWPVCYGNKIHDSDFDQNVYVRDPCLDTEAPIVELQAHSAPLGLGFYFGNKFPEEYRGNLFVALHGSWNRGEPTGYKIVRIILKEKPIVEDFAFGWLQGQKVLGRPVDIVEKDGDLFVSDDNAGKIYRIFYS